MSWIDILGYSAALAVLAAFCMSSIVALRIVAILSNVLFALYGLAAHLYPVFLLHSILLVGSHRAHQAVERCAERGCGSPDLGCRVAG